MKGPSKTFVAAGLLVAALAVLLVAWFSAGMADVRARQHAQLAVPVERATGAGVTLARELRAELAGLIGREIERPYFHYQNLMRDPRSSSGVSVTPSPLADGPDDRLVIGYFQLDARGKTTTPTINDDVPALSEPRRLAEHRRFRDEVIASLATPLAPPPRARAEAAAVVAEVERPARPRPRTPTPRVPERAQQVEAQAQVIQIDRSTYTQNNLSNSIYQRNLPEGLQEVTPPLDAVGTPETAVESPSTVTSPEVTPPVVRRPVVKKAAPVTAADPVTIVVSPLEWRTLAFGGAPSLVAVREVETPDDMLVQGFVVDRATLTSWLATRAGDAVVELVPGDGDAATELAPGWHLTATANPRVIANATAEAAGVAMTFLLRFVVLGVLALVAGALVVLLVSRAERLARERSQFAAAAAHELRTPLAGLQLYGDMLADGLGDPAKQRDYARRMSEEASRLGRVVSNVLGFSQLERGNLSVEPKVGRLDDELRRLAERAEPALDRAGAALALDVAPELSARFDRDALARIVGNLLDNAEKYGRDAEDRTISLTARTAGEGVEIEVADHGPGITDKARARLFRPFVRGVAADGPAGLGLGLALSQSLARAMGGELAYRRPSDGGAAFVLRLPRT